MYKGRVLAAANPGSNLTYGPLLHVIPPLSLSPFQHCTLYNKRQKSLEKKKKKKKEIDEKW